jgi:uncharacterized protein YgiM (DUF1202 family)
VPVLKDRISEVPPLDIIGQTYQANTNSNLRGGPGTDYVRVGRLEKGETFHVVGKVKDANWYLVSYDGVGSGFVFGDLIAAAPTEEPAKENTSIAQSEVVEQEVTAEQTCQTIDQNVVLPDNSTVSDTIEGCQTATGWESLAS